MVWLLSGKEREERARTKMQKRHPEPQKKKKSNPRTSRRGSAKGGGGSRRDPQPLLLLPHKNSESKREHENASLRSFDTPHSAGIRADAAERRPQRSTRSQAPLFSGAPQCQAGPCFQGLCCGLAAQRKSLDLGSRRTTGPGAPPAQRGDHQHERGRPVCRPHTQRPFFIVGFCVRRLRFLL